MPLRHAGGNKIRSLHFERGKRLIAIFFDTGWGSVNISGAIVCVPVVLPVRAFQVLGAAI